MNHRQIEVLAEQERRQIQDEMRQIRLEEEAISQVRSQDWFAYVMVQFGNWMIAIGQHIRRRYENPCMPHLHTPKGDFAR